MGEFSRVFGVCGFLPVVRAMGRCRVVWETLGGRSQFWPIVFHHTHINYAHVRMNTTQLQLYQMPSWPPRYHKTIEVSIPNMLNGDSGWVSALMLHKVDERQLKAPALN
jgi:hypothetical protein